MDAILRAMLCASAIVHAMPCEPLLQLSMRYHRMITIDAINRTKTKVQIIELSRCEHAISRIDFHQQTKCSRHRISM